MPFQPISAADDEVLLRLEASPATLAVYPSRSGSTCASRSGVAAHDEATLAMTARRRFPRAFGFHPRCAGRCPYGGARGDHIVRFDQPEPAPIRRIGADQLLARDASHSPVEGDVLALDDSLFLEDAVIFDRLTSRALWYGVEGRPGVRVTFPDMPALGLWTKPGAGYLCIEPWQGMADPTGFAGEFRQKPWVVEVPAGGHRRSP
jgi:galactose mutarotase-like enzyme